MYIKSKLAKSVRLALAFGAASTLAIGSNAIAQEESAEEEKVEKIAVTGSRIRQTDLETSAPVTSITREDLVIAGISDVGDLLQRLPAASGSPIGTTTNNGGSGAVQVNLRGMGTARTLVLINGRRVVEGNDFQTIPSTMIDRVDILKDGASAVYGADAVAGVVNIITRKDFEGLEIELQTSDNFDTDTGVQNKLSLIAGKAFDGGNVVFGIEYVDQEEVYQGGTDVTIFNNSYFIVDTEGYDANGFITADQDPDNFTVVGLGSSRVPGSNLNFNPNSQYAAGSWTLDPSNFGGNGFTTPDQWRAYNGSIFDPNNDSYNYAPVNYLQTPYERFNVFAETSFEINDTTMFNSLVRYNVRESAQELAPVPYDTQFDPGYQVALLDADGNPTGGFANGISGDNVYNPFGEDIIRSRRRMVEAPRRFAQDITQVQAVFSLEGELTDTWYWDATYNYGHRSASFVDSGQYVGSRLSLALGPSFLDADGNAVCGTPDAVIAGCVPLNLFGGPNTVTQEMLDYVSADLVDTFTASLEILTLGVSGEFDGIGAGPIGVAFGYEFREESTDNTVDSGKSTEAVTGNTGDVASGSYHVNSLFAEAIVPILDGDMNLEFNAGFRYDDYSTFGSNETFQAGLKFEPMDGLLLRATYGEVFREPGVGELFSPQSDGFPAGQDPCNDANFGNLSADGQARCVAQGVPQGGYFQADTQFRSRTGGNPNVQPEEGETFTVGIAWSPEFVEGFSITLDYFDVELEGVIASVNATTILDGCYESGIDAFCSNISRLPTGGIDAVVSLIDNLNVRNVEGIDVELDYNLETEFGDFDFGLIWTHLIDRSDIVIGLNEAGEVAQVEIEKAGNFDFDDGEAFAENKVNFTLDWSYEDFSVSYLAEYIDGIDAEISFFDYTQTVDAELYHDLIGAYTFDTDTRVTVGVLNFTDEEAPYIDAGFNASTDPSTYRMFGRSWY